MKYFSAAPHTASHCRPIKYWQQRLEDEDNVSEHYECRYNTLLSISRLLHGSPSVDAETPDTKSPHFHTHSHFQLRAKLNYTCPMICDRQLRCTSEAVGNLNTDSCLRPTVAGIYYNP